MRLGRITNQVQDVRPTNASQNTTRDSFSFRQSDKIPDNDSTVAAIRLHRAEDSGIVQSAAESIAATFEQQLNQFAKHFSETLARYKELSEKVATGTFSPTTLRNQIDRLKEAVSSSAEKYHDKNSDSFFWAQEEIKSASRGTKDTRALAWLKDQAKGAMFSQHKIEPARVLALLR